MAEKSGLSAVVFWAVIAGVFGVIFVRHLKDLQFEYPAVALEDRLNTKNQQGKEVAMKSRSSMGPLVINSITYTDGTKSGSIEVNGTPLDAPASISVKGLNDHIKLLNEQKYDENVILLILDAVGFFSAAFSAVYELRRTRNAATV